MCVLMSDCLEDLENGVTKSSPESYHAVRVGSSTESVIFFRFCMMHLLFPQRNPIRSFEIRKI